MMHAGLDDAARRREVEALLSRGCYGGNAPIETAMGKHLAGEALVERRRLIAEKWTELQKRLKAQLIPGEEMRRMLSEAGCPVEPSQIGLSREQYLHGLRTAQLLRRRYTILDFLYELGVLDDVVARLPYA
jgi:glycerol-1-phosphate dehydrogenase [NAD(P)+]